MALSTELGVAFLRFCSSNLHCFFNVFFYYFVE